VIEEEALFVGIGAAETEIVLDRVRIEEVLRRLHEADLGIVEERQSPGDEIGMRNEIGIEHRDEVRRRGIAAENAERVIDVAGL